MVNESKKCSQHVGELLSGLIDGELTQQERQRVDLHCEQCQSCREDLTALRAVRERIGRSEISESGEDRWSCLLYTSDAADDFAVV